MNAEPLPAGIVLSALLCSSCEAAIGKYHTDECDIACCAVTGLQRSAGCRGARGCRVRPGADCRTRWSGAFPGAAEAREYGLYCLARPPYEPCEPGTPGSMEDINTLYKRCVWDRAAGRWRLKGDTA
jgi:hypothetical protein